MPTPLSRRTPAIYAYETVSDRAERPVLGRGPVLDVPDPLRSPAAEPAGVANGGEFATLEEAERVHVREALRRAGGVIYGPRGAAALLGVKSTTLRLQSRMERLGLLGAGRARRAKGDDP